MLYFIYSLACFMLPCLVYQVFGVLALKRRNRRVKAVHFIWSCLFLIYIWMVYTVTGVGTLSDIGRYEELIRAGQINLVPFASVFTISYILNIIMFMPLGFLLPLIWDNYRSWWKVTLTGALLSLLIELSQLFNLRASDIDDLMTNTAGALFGYLFYLLFFLILKRKPAGKGLGKLEAGAYLLLSMAGTVIFYNPYKIW